MDEATLRVLGRTITAYSDKVAALRARLLSFVAGTWARLGEYRDGDIDRFVAVILPAVGAGQVQIANLTDAYLAQVESAVMGERVAPVGVPSSVVATVATRGTTAAEVYRRAGVTVWSALSTGSSLADAVGKGGSRAESIVATDLQLAKTHAARFVLADKSTVVGFRRVLEMDSCDLCIGASSARYRKAELLPIHPHCDCGVEPIYALRDPRPVSTPAVDPDLVTVHQHGEVGPVLAYAGQAFVGPNDI